jgi:thymidylate kinase
MSTVALIGSDGVGKTAVAKGLLDVCPLELKYLYMGMSVESSNVALPTSRLAHRVKVAQHKRSLKQSGKTVPSQIRLHGIEHRLDRRGRLGATARLLKRISEEAYRQVISWSYQWRGLIVLYDRHFLFDSLPPPSELHAPRRATDRIHHWFLYRLYPRPDLVILLDADPEVLLARKQEVPEAYLRAEREALEEKRAYANKWVKVDASQPFDQVLATINAAIIEHCGPEASSG